MHFSQMAAAHHAEPVEGMEGIGEAVFADVIFPGGEIFAVAVHIGQNIHGIVLEHFIELDRKSVV